MPGVTINTAIRTGASAAGTVPGAAFFVVGETERGPDTFAVACTSIDDYTTAFGGFVSGKYLYQSVYTFFEEGGSLAYVARAVKSSGSNAKASLVLISSGSTAGATLTAAGGGDWGENISVTVSAPASGVYTFTIFYDGVEIWTGGYENSGDLVDAINNSAVLKNYVTASTTTRSNTTFAAVASAASLANPGTDGAAATADFITALDLFTEDLGSGCVAIPGAVDTSTSTTRETNFWDLIKDHCVANNRVALLSFEEGEDAGTVSTMSTDYTGDDHEYLAFYHPWITIPYLGNTISISPEAYVAAARSKTVTATGTWEAYAGEITIPNFVNGVAEVVGRTVGDALDAAYVNAIRVINGDVRIYGARSHSTNVAQWRFITNRDTVNYIVDRCALQLESLIFSTINGRKTLYGNIESAIQGILEPIRLSGGFYEGFDARGRRTDYGYTIAVNDTLNPVSQLQTGLVKAQVGVRISSIGDKITVNIIKSNLTTNLA
jgi:hypothetical protein